MIAPRKILLTALIAAAALAVGCGDDDETTTSTDTGATGATGVAAPLSDDEYADKIRPYLTNFSEESQRLGEELQATTTNDEAAPLVEDLETLTQTTIDDLESVGPPDDATDGHQALVDALDGYLTAISALLGVIETGSDVEIQEAGADFVAAAEETLGQLEEARQQLEEAGISVGDPISTEIPEG